MKYLHMDMTHGGANTVKANARAKFLARFPNNVMSVNMNLDETEAVIKVTDDYKTSSRAVIRVYSGAPLDLVRTTEWKPTV